MCIAIWKPKGVTIPKNRFENCFDHNPHGIGFAVAIGGTVSIVKGFFDIDSFWEAFNGFQKYPAIVHFRLATHGAINEDNCHPFKVTDDLAMIHNGIITEFALDHSTATKGKVSKSDTWLFTESICTPFAEEDPNFLEDIEVRKMIEDFIGKYNKLVFLSDKGEATILNEGSGEWYKGAWYSNDGYKARRWENWVPSRSIYTRTYDNTPSDSRYEYDTETQSYIRVEGAFDWSDTTDMDWCDACGDAFADEELIHIGEGNWVCDECWYDFKTGKWDEDEDEPVSEESEDILASEEAVVEYIRRMA